MGFLPAPDRQTDQDGEVNEEYGRDYRHVAQTAGPAGPRSRSGDDFLVTLFTRFPVCSMKFNKVNVDRHALAL